MLACTSAEAALYSTPPPQPGQHGQVQASLGRGKGRVAGAARGGTGALVLHHELELRGSLQMPKSLLVMTPTMVLSTSQVKPLSQGHL